MGAHKKPEPAGNPETTASGQGHLTPGKVVPAKGHGAPPTATHPHKNETPKEEEGKLKKIFKKAGKAAAEAAEDAIIAALTAPSAVFGCSSEPIGSKGGAGEDAGSHQEANKDAGSDSETNKDAGSSSEANKDAGVDAGAVDSGTGPDEQQTEQFIMGKLPFHRNIAFAPVTITPDLPLRVVDDAGHETEVTGQLLFVEANREVHISNRYIDVKDQHSTLFFYDPATKNVYYYDGDSKYYGSANRNKPFKTASVSEVKYVEGGAEVSIDLEAEYGFALEVLDTVDQVRQNYMQWVTDGLSQMGADVGLANYFDKDEADGLLEGVKLVIHRDGAFCRAEFPSILVSDAYTDPLKKEPLKGMILHEFGHLAFTAISKSNGTEGEEFYMQSNPSFMEGSNQFLTLLALLSAPSEFNHLSDTYGPAVEMTTILFDALGPDKFFTIFFNPSEIDYENELSGLLGKSYSELSQHYSRSTAMLPGGYDPIAMLNTIRLMGELQEAGIIDFDSMLEQHETTMQTLYNNSLNPFLTRYGLGPGLILDQSYNGSTYMGWNPNASHPYDVRAAASNAMEGDLAAIANRYKDHFLILNSLDYTNYDPKTQMAAAGVLKNMLEDFASYWNGLSSEERLGSLPQREGSFIYLASFALGGRYGICVSSLLSTFNDVMGTDAEMDFGSPAPHILPVSSIQTDIQGSPDINSKITSGTVVLTLPAAWADSLQFYSEGGVKNTVTTTAGTTVTITFSNGNATISGLSVETTSE